jgi:catechol 2,3-dioxygenase-like lactoylglutathione lyase family enzyme
MMPRLERIDHIHVYVSDRARAEAWYARVLGLARIPELEIWAADGGPLTLADPSHSIHLALFERPHSSNHATIAMAVAAEQFIAWRAHLTTELGNAMAVVDHDLAWSMYFADPDGNPFEITCYDYAELAIALR